MNRRTFLAVSASGTAGLFLRPPLARAVLRSEETELFRISLAEWSLHKNLRAGRLKNTDFPIVARREFGIDTIEYVDQFFRDKAEDEAYLAELKRIADGEGVRTGLVMLDTNGPLATADRTKREQSIEKTKIWIDAAKSLGATVVRVNARGDRGMKPEEIAKRMAESGAVLADYAAERGVAVAIENHGGPSSDPDWLTGVMRAAGKKNFGTLPDFGNFPRRVDRYAAVEKLMPFAQAVSAKATKFENDRVVDTDFRRMLRIVRDAGYRGDIGIESAGVPVDGEYAAVRTVRDELARVRAVAARCRPLFNGRDLDGWVQVEGGEWTVEDGTLVGRRGVHWTTNPETTGSWLRTEKTWKDFRLELQYTVNTKGNSGVFFRAAADKKPRLHRLRDADLRRSGPRTGDLGTGRALRPRRPEEEPLSRGRRVEHGDDRSARPAHRRRDERGARRRHRANALARGLHRTPESRRQERGALPERAHRDAVTGWRHARRRSPRSGVPALVLGALVATLGGSPVARAAHVVVNEIFYHPPDDAAGNEPALDFIELHNPTGDPVDVSGWSFTEGVVFRFPAGSRIEAGGFLVVAAAPKAIRSEFGMPALGPWTGSLSNSGERLTLVDARRRVVDRVAYDDEAPWPVSPDGYGASLERVHATGSSDLANWAPSGWPEAQATNDDGRAPTASTITATPGRPKPKRTIAGAAVRRSARGHAVVAKYEERDHAQSLGRERARDCVGGVRLRVLARRKARVHGDALRHADRGK